MEFQTRIFWNFYQNYCSFHSNKPIPVHSGDLAKGPKDRYVIIIRNYYGDSLYDMFNSSCMRAFIQRFQREYPKRFDFTKKKYRHLWQLELDTQTVLTKDEYIDFLDRYWMSCKQWFIRISS